MCFTGLALNNAMLFVDLAILPEIDLLAWRSGIALGAMGLLVFGVIWESR